MAMDNITLYFFAFGGGLISFISPCNAALLPTFISYISAQSKNLKGNFIMSLLFSIGYSLMFSIIGVVLQSLDDFITGVRYLNLISGIIIILLSLYLLFSKQIYLSKGLGYLQNYTEKIGIDENIEGPGDKREKKDEFFLKESFQGYFGAFLLGLSLGTAFIPCITPMYASILTISLQYDTAVQISLTLIYAFGLTLPFIVIGLLIGKIYSSEILVVKIVKYGKTLQKVFSLFLLWIGIEIILTGYGYSGLIPII